MAVSGSGLSQGSGSSSGGSSTFSGCRVKLAAQLTAQNYSSETALPFTEEVFDTDGFHDNATNNTRITIPSGLDGYYGVLTAVVQAGAVSANSAFFLRIIRNATDDADNIMALEGENINSTVPSLTVTTPPILFSAGDYFEAWFRCSDTSINIEEHTSFGISILGAGS